MTSFARQVQRRQERTTEGRLKRLNMVLPNFNISTPVEPKVTSRGVGDYTPLPNKKRERRRAVKLARRMNRG